MQRRGGGASRYGGGGGRGGGGGGGAGAWAWAAWARLGAYKPYVALALVPYLCLVLLFHTHLTVYDAAGKRADGDADGVNAVFAAGEFITSRPSLRLH